MKNKYLVFLLLPLLLVALFFYFKLPTSSCLADLTREAKNEIIEHALSLELSAPDNVNSPEAIRVSDAAAKKVQKANYEEAIEITVAGLKQFPHDFSLQADLASLLGDTSEITDSPLKERMLQKATQLFDALLPYADSQPKQIYFPFMNEYFYRFKKYRQQYELGQQRVAYYWGTPEWQKDSNGFRGYYSQGVGAANYARKLMNQGNKQLAYEYAQKALVAWAQYFSYKNTYYNAYVHYALALGILGYKEEMMRALQKSAGIINRDLDYFEFKDVIDFVGNL